MAGEYFNIFDSQLFLWFTYLLVACLGLNCCRLMIQSLKNNGQSTIIPYGPALVFGAFVVMFLL